MEEQISCRRCNISKPIDEFHKNITNKNLHFSQYWCKSCRSQYAKDIWKLNSTTILEQRAKRSLLLRLELIKRLGGKCSTCGNMTFLHLEIDHVNNDGNTERKVYGYGMKDKIIKMYLDGRKDISKLQVLCANCNHEKQMKRNKHMMKVYQEVMNSA